jgi:transposase
VNRAYVSGASNRLNRALLRDVAVSDQIEALKAALAAAEARADKAESEAAHAKALASCTAALVEHLKLEIAKLKREQYGQTSERGARLIDQMEFQLEDLEATAAEDDIAAETAAAKAGVARVSPHLRRRPAKKPFPAHLPRDRVVVPGPAVCSCCGSARLAKLGEDITETLEVVPRQWKVIQTVREKFTCRDCERISQPAAPFHAIPRAHAGPGLLAMVLFEKFGQHQPLNRQSERYAREGIDLSLSTLADHVGSAAFALQPLFALIEKHVLAAERLHGDDTTVPVLAKGKTITGRLWTYVRDDKPFGGTDPPAAVFHYSRDRTAAHPEQHLERYSGIFQADAYSGFNNLYKEDRKPSRIIEAGCWAHGRRKFYVLADVTRNAQSKTLSAISPIALEAVKKIDAIFDIERTINGASADIRLVVRKEHVASLVEDLHDWMTRQRANVSAKSDIGKALSYMLKRWDAFARFLEDGRICLTNNAAERALRGIALGRKSWLFAGSDRGGERAAMMNTLIYTAKLNDIDPQAWLADVLARIADQNSCHLEALLPWNWKMEHALTAQVAQTAA